MFCLLRIWIYRPRLAFTFTTWRTQFQMLKIYAFWQTIKAGELDESYQKSRRHIGMMLKKLTESILKSSKSTATDV